MPTLNFARALRTLSAHSFGQAITVLGVVGVPWVCLGHWSAEEFGIWIIATAISQFFLISDLGLSSAIANQLCLDEKIAPSTANQLISEAFKIILRRILFSLLIAIVIALFLTLSKMRSGYREFTVSIEPSVFLLLTISTSTQPLVGLFCAVMRFHGRNGTGIFVSNVGRFFELLALSVAVYLDAGLLLAAASIAIVKLLIVGFLTSFTISNIRYSKNFLTLTFESSLVSAKTHRAGVGIAANFFALNLLLHGLVLIASIGGSVSAAIFSSTRTITRLPTQPLGIIFSSIAPEITDIYKNKDKRAFRRITLILTFGTTVFTTAVMTIAYTFREELERYWLHGKISIPQELLLTMGIGMLAHIIWQSGSQTLTAINKTLKIGLTYLAVGCITIIMATIVQFSSGPVGIALVWAISELIMCFAVWQRLLNVLASESNWKTL